MIGGAVQTGSPARLPHCRPTVGSHVLDLTDAGQTFDGLFIRANHSAGDHRRDRRVAILTRSGLTTFACRARGAPGAGDNAQPLMVRGILGRVQAVKRGIYAGREPRLGRRRRLKA
jgi:hypothetical protein